MRHWKSWGFVCKMSDFWQARVLGGVACAVERVVWTAGNTVGGLQAGSGVCRQNFWCKADSSCRGKREAAIREVQKGKKAEVSGRGLSCSADRLLMMYMLGEPTGQALLERGKRVQNLVLRDWMKWKQHTHCLFLITNSGDWLYSVLAQWREITIPVLPLYTSWVSYSSIFISEHRHLPLPEKCYTHLSSISSTVCLRLCCEIFVFSEGCLWAEMTGRLKQTIAFPLLNTMT